MEMGTVYISHPKRARLGCDHINALYKFTITTYYIYYYRIPILSKNNLQEGSDQTYKMGLIYVYTNMLTEGLDESMSKRKIILKPVLFGLFLHFKFQSLY